MDLPGARPVWNPGVLEFGEDLPVISHHAGRAAARLADWPPDRRVGSRATIGSCGTTPTRSRARRSAFPSHHRSTPSTTAEPAVRPFWGHRSSIGHGRLRIRFANDGDDFTGRDRQVQADNRRADLAVRRYPMSSPEISTMGPTLGFVRPGCTVAVIVRAPARLLGDVIEGERAGPRRGPRVDTTRRSPVVAAAETSVPHSDDGGGAPKPRKDTATRWR